MEKAQTLDWTDDEFCPLLISYSKGIPIGCELSNLVHENAVDAWLIDLFDAFYCFTIAIELCLCFD